MKDSLLTAPRALALVPLLMLPVVLGAMALLLHPGDLSARVVVIAGGAAVAWYLLGGVIAVSHLIEQLRVRRDIRVLGPAMQAEAGPVWAVDLHGQVLAQNDAAAARLDLLGRPIAVLLAQCRADPQPLMESTLHRMNRGHKATIDLGEQGVMTLSRRPGARVLLCGFDPVTMPDAATAAPAPAELMGNLPVALLRLRRDGIIVQANDAAMDLLGAELTGRNIDTLLEGPGRPLQDWLSDVAGSRPTGRGEVLRCAGPGPDKFLQVALTSCETTESALIAVLTDASALKTLEAQFVQSQKMQAIGQLAGGIAHDFNNLLTAISGHCDLLMLRHDKADPDYADLHQIGQNANRAAALVGQLLAFSRKQTLKPRVLDLRDTLSDLTHLLNRLVGEPIILTLIHDPALKPIRADKRQLEQVIMNLVVNARDAMHEGGEIEIRTDNMRLSGPEQRDRVMVPRGDYVRVTVRDQGCGIPPEQLGKIFEPFYTTKKLGEGTGLGLSTAYGIIKQTGGYIFCFSEPGQGTTFELLFPVHRPGAADVDADPPEAAPAPIDPAAAADGPSGTVLLVEDEAPVRAFAVRALRLRGFDVLECDNAEAALDLLSDDRVHVDVFVTDVVMPGMDGPTWVRAALRHRPGTRVVFMSGYTEHALSDSTLAIADSVFLPKPFSLSELTTCVERQVGRAQGQGGRSDTHGAGQ